MATDENANALRQFDLQAEHELRFEVPADCTNATLTLISGSAEVFGVEMALNRAYALSPALNAAAFTWFGARLTLVAPPSALAYTATDTPMPDYIRVHAVLQSRRDRALQTGDRTGGPRAVIVGPRDAGKTALANILTAYCVKANASSILVDLDPAASGPIAVVPGAISVSVVTHLDIEEGGPVHDRVSTTMYGHVSALDNLLVVKKLMSSITTVLDGLMTEQKNSPASGCIVDMCGDVDGTEGLDLALAGITAVRADIVLVLGGERLFASIRSRLADSPTEVVLLTKSGGVVTRDTTIRQQARSRCIKEYFYGADNRLNPFSTVIDFTSVTILQIAGQASVVPDSVLPIGFESTLDPLKPSKVSLSRDLLHALLGVSQAEVEDDVLSKPVYGFVHVSKVDTERNTLTVLAPSPGRIPSKFFIQGSIKWME
jgi:polyribonucleotide 5'-hydroxyl-kinase